MQEKASAAWHREWVTKTSLKQRWNYTDKAIADYLKRLKLHDHGRGRFGNIFAYKIASVQKVERDNTDFRVWMEQRIEKQIAKGPPTSSASHTYLNFSSDSYAYQALNRLSRR